MIKDFFKSLFKINRETKIFIGIIVLLVIIGAIVKSTEPFCAFGIGDCTSRAETKVVDITEQIQNIDQSIKQKIDQQCLIANTATNQLNILDSVVTNLNVEQKNIIK